MGHVFTFTAYLGDFGNSPFVVAQPEILPVIGMYRNFVESREENFANCNVFVLTRVMIAEAIAGIMS
ncbi:MAG: hypothetical protein ACI9CO_000043 [Candidatus Azotimanducaceae bacterium]|jgi:hypothetical protein